jgi:hypothetical protein
MKRQLDDYDESSEQENNESSSAYDRYDQRIKKVRYFHYELDDNIDSQPMDLCEDDDYRPLNDTEEASLSLSTPPSTTHLNYWDIPSNNQLQHLPGEVWSNIIAYTDDKSVLFQLHNTSHKIRETLSGNTNLWAEVNSKVFGIKSMHSMLRFLQSVTPNKEVTTLVLDDLSGFNVDYMKRLVNVVPSLTSLNFHCKNVTNKCGIYIPQFKFLKELSLNTVSIGNALFLKLLECGIKLDSLSLTDCKKLKSESFDTLLKEMNLTTLRVVNCRKLFGPDTTSLLPKSLLHFEYTNYQDAPVGMEHAINTMENLKYVVFCLY